MFLQQCALLVGSIKKYKSLGHGPSIWPWFRQLNVLFSPFILMSGIQKDIFKSLVYTLLGVWSRC